MAELQLLFNPNSQPPMIFSDIFKVFSCSRRHCIALQFAIEDFKQNKNPTWEIYAIL